MKGEAVGAARFDATTPDLAGGSDERYSPREKLASISDVWPLSVLIFCALGNQVSLQEIFRGDGWFLAMDVVALSLWLPAMMWD